MQVTMLTKAMPPALTGGDIYVVYLTKALRASVQTSVWSVSPCDAAAGNPTISSPARRYGVVGEAQGLTPALEHVLLRNMELVGQVPPADVLHAHTWYSFLAAVALKRRDRCPLVVTIHSLDVMRVWKKISDPALPRFTTALESLAISEADRVIVPSESGRRDVVNWMPAAGAKTLVIPSGVDASIFRPEAARGSVSGLPEHVRDYLLVSARVSRQKDWDLALDVVKQVPGDIPVVLHLGTADDPAHAARVRSRISEIGRGRDEIYTLDDQWLSPDQMATLFARSRLFLCTSVYETFGLVLVEAMSCGVPVVSTAFPAAVEVLGVEPASAALGPPAFDRADDTEYRRQLCDVLSSQVLQYFRSTAAWASARRQSLRRAERFSWQSVAEAHAGLYRELSSGSPRLA